MMASFEFYSMNLVNHFSLDLSIKIKELACLHSMHSFYPKSIRGVMMNGKLSCPSEPSSSSFCRK
jgi:hypothetical protein